MKVCVKCVASSDGDCQITRAPQCSVALECHIPIIFAQEVIMYLWHFLLFSCLCKPVASIGWPVVGMAEFLKLCSSMVLPMPSVHAAVDNVRASPTATTVKSPPLTTGAKPATSCVLACLHVRFAHRCFPINARHLCIVMMLQPPQEGQHTASKHLTSGKGLSRARCDKLAVMMLCLVSHYCLRSLGGSAWADISVVDCTCNICVLCMQNLCVF